MPTVEHETNHQLFDRDVEKRIRRFGNLTIVALCNCIVLIFHVGTLWVCIKSVPADVPFPFPLRWACILCLNYEIIRKNAWLFHIIRAITIQYILKIEDEKRSQNRDLEIRTTELEDWILAHFCVIVGLSTIGFVTWYWVEVIALSVRTFFYWTCTIGGLCLLLWLFKRTIRFYRKAKGLKHEEAWGILIVANVLRLYNKFEELMADGSLGQLIIVTRLLLDLPKTMLYVVGFHIGRGPLFDCLPDEWKAARRACKTWKDVANFFAVCAGTSDEEGDNKEDSQDRNDTGEACFSPSAFEWQPNPVIFAHLRDEHLQSSDPGPSVAKDTSDCHLKNTAEAAGKFPPGLVVNFDDTGIPENNQKSPSVPRPTGPATMPANLSSFACPQCPYVAKKKHKLNKHITQTHDRPFICDYHGCGKTFGLRANLERHEATHREREGLKCPNSWCKIPEMTFTREDNLQRHMRQCINF